VVPPIFAILLFVTIANRLRFAAAEAHAATSALRATSDD
jgi:hypothetical protein